MNIWFCTFFLQYFYHIRMWRQIRAANTKIDDILSLLYSIHLSLSAFEKNNIRQFLLIFLTFAYSLQLLILNSLIINYYFHNPLL